MTELSPVLPGDCPGTGWLEKICSRPSGIWTSCWPGNNPRTWILPSALLTIWTFCWTGAAGDWTAGVWTAAAGGLPVWVRLGMATLPGGAAIWWPIILPSLVMKIFLAVFPILLSALEDINFIPEDPTVLIIPPILLSTLPLLKASLCCLRFSSVLCLISCRF